MTNNLNKPKYFFNLLNSKERVVIEQGGTSSGKTCTTLDVLFYIGIQEPNSVITVVGQDVPNLKKGAYRDAKYIWGKSPDYQLMYDKPNETDRIFKCKNGTIIEFTSYQDEQDAKSGKRDYLFVNEANGISHDIYWQLAIRTKKRIFLDYNPNERFWAHDLINEPDTIFFRTWHVHNPFLTQEQHDRIEGIKDKELWEVYARGYTGKISGLIYTNWALCDEMPKDYKKRYIGVDFGFTNDPTAIIDVRLSNGELWVHEIAYSNGLLNTDIARILKDYGVGTTTIIADSAEPKSIAELRSHGLNVEPAKKGADSIKNGIDILKRYKINITKSSAGVRKEIGSYKYKVTRDGLTLNEPIDFYNHAMDAIRYVGLNYFNTYNNNYSISVI
jgi:phage terminase large subunit